MEAGKEIVSVFLSFDQFLEISENLDWFNVATFGQVETLLKNASKLESICNDLATKGLSCQFQNKLHKWWLHRQMPYCYELDYFKNACDIVLRNTLHLSASETVLEYAVCCYLRACGRDRFCNLVKDIMLEGISYRVLSSLFLKPESVLGVDLRSQLLLKYWVKELNHSGQENIAKQIKECRGESLHIIVNILTLDLKQQLELQAQEVILKEFLGKMGEDETFSYIITLDANIIANLCEKHSSFFNLLLNGLVQMGKSFRCSYDDHGATWTSSLVDVTFGHMVQLIKCLCHKNYHLKSRLLEFIEQIIKNPGCSLWEDIGRECSLFT